jgi:hypothetical protein
MYSIWKCAFCKPIEKRSYEAALLEAERMGWDAKRLGVTAQYMNPTTCPYNYVRIDDKIYKRDDGNIFDDCAPLESLTGKHCHDCGVLYGRIHHVDCNSERCPKCRRQLLSCECAIKGVKYYRGPTDFGKYHKGLMWKVARFLERIRS